MLLILSITTFSQPKFIPDIKYTKQSIRATALYDDKEYLQSGLAYDSLFMLNDGRGSKGDKYDAACSWALAGNNDKAFFYLNKVTTENKYTDLFHLLSDTDLSSLHTDKRWQKLINAVTINKNTVEAKYNKPVAALLDTIYKEDQGNRTNIEVIKRDFGWQSPQMDSLLTRMRYYDSLNLLRVKNIIKTYGWLGEDQIGEQGNATLFLVIQHADPSTRLNYLPIMREAVLKGNAKPQDLALLEDRVLTNQGKKQTYGSQIKVNEKGKYEFYPIEDEPNVDKRRAAVGLGTLEQYALYFGLEYKLPKE